MYLLALFSFLAREDSVRYLVDIGVPVGTFDDTGMSTMAHMVEKMPHIAVDALDQFLHVDTAFRKEYYYLNYLEYNPIKWQEENVTEDEHGVPIVLSKEEIKKRKREKKSQCITTPLKVKHFLIFYVRRSALTLLDLTETKIFDQFLKTPFHY